MTDSQSLLTEYARSGSDAAFRELVSRFVDLVYSTALRLVEGDTHRAEDVTQTVFVDLARQARTLSKEVRLGGWLHRHTCFVAANTLRGERRRQSRERQAVEMNALQNTPGADFSQVAPLLDEAINELGEEDRIAILLRFFERQDFHAVGAALGSNGDAARMRVNRALEKLESLLKQRGVTTSAGALAIALAANAVQAAPTGLAVTISTAAALAGTSAAITATKIIAMTTLQKAIMGTVLAAAVGTGIYEAHQATQWREQNQELQQERAEQLRQLQRERDDATNRLARLLEEIAQLKSNSDKAELLKLRGEVGVLRRQIADTKATQEASTNQIQFVYPYLGREEWSDKGTDKLLNTILTMFWAIRQRDEDKLEQIISRAYASQRPDQLTLPKGEWDKLAGVQIISVATMRGGPPRGRLEDLASVQALVNVAPMTDGGTKDLEVHKWSLKKTNDRWLITYGY